MNKKKCDAREEFLFFVLGCCFVDILVATAVI